MRIESKLEDMYINDLIKVHKYLTSRQYEYMTPYGIKTGSEKIHEEYRKEVEYLESVIFSEYKKLSKNSKSHNSSEPQEYYIP